MFSEAIAIKTASNQTFRLLQTFQLTKETVPPPSVCDAAPALLRSWPVFAYEPPEKPELRRYSL